MPAGKKQDAITLTFSKKNNDIFKFLEDKKKKDKRFVQSDYICEAVRFYNKHKDSMDLMNADAINRLIEMKLAALNISTTANEEKCPDEENEEYIALKKLESDIYNVDIEDD